MKKIIALVLVALMTLSVAAITVSAAEPAAWDGTTKTAFAGEGTEASPYLIADAANLAYLAEQVNAGNNYAGKYLKQTADIDLGGKEWTPIGTLTSTTDHKSFSGNYDGAGYEVKGLSITTDGGRMENGLFGCVWGVEGQTVTTVKNLTVSGAIAFEGGKDNGAIAGIVARANWDQGTVYPVVIENCTSNVTVTIKTAAQPRVAGAIGMAFGAQITNVVNNGNVTVNAAAAVRAGGVLGQTNRTTIKSCVNNGKITGETSVSNINMGGIVAVATRTGEGIWTDISYCVNNGELSGVTTANGTVYLAGILGSPYSGNSNYYHKIAYCVNTANLYGYTKAGTYAHVGGIYSYANKAYLEINNCVNLGVKIESYAKTNEDGTAKVNRPDAGIIGTTSGAKETVKIQNNVSVTAKWINTNYNSTAMAQEGNVAEATAAQVQAALLPILAGINPAYIAVVKGGETPVGTFTFAAGAAIPASALTATVNGEAVEIAVENGVYTVKAPEAMMTAGTELKLVVALAGVPYYNDAATVPTPELPETPETGDYTAVIAVVAVVMAVLGTAVLKRKYNA